MTTRGEDEHTTGFEEMRWERKFRHNFKGGQVAEATFVIQKGRVRQGICYITGGLPLLDEWIDWTHHIDRVLGTTQVMLRTSVYVRGREDGVLYGPWVSTWGIAGGRR
jgi:hypothetical protein